MKLSWLLSLCARIVLANMRYLKPLHASRLKDGLRDYNIHTKKWKE